MDPNNWNANPDFIEVRRQLADFFTYYREGRPYSWRDRYLQRPRPWQNMKIPWPGPWRGYQRAEVNLVPYRPREFATTEPQNASQDLNNNPQVRQTIEGEPQVYKSERYTLNFRKVLGWGGFGIATLYSLEDQDGNFLKDVVVKYTMPGTHENFYAEKEAHDVFARARNITQVVWFNKPQTDPTPAPSSSARGARVGSAELPGLAASIWGPNASRADAGLRPALFGGGRVASAPVVLPAGGPGIKVQTDAAMDADIYTMVLEVMQRGSLESWVCRMAASGQRFSNKVMWLVFDCLFQGVVAMAWPPSHRDNKKYVETGGKFGPMEEEQIPTSDDDQWFTDDWTNFDLDPSNILVGDFHQGYDFAHTLIPIIKIADLGLARASRSLGIPEEGKVYTNHLVPEQFHEEWEHLTSCLPDLEPDPALKPQIAGQFGWKTNLYGIAMIMWNMITLLKNPDRPWPYYEMTRNPLTGEIVIDESKINFGGYLQHDRFEHVEWDLRTIVAKCMSEKPADRPGMKQLYNLIRKKIRQEWPGETDDQTREWADSFFRGPGPQAPESQPDPMTGVVQSAGPRAPNVTRAYDPVPRDKYTPQPTLA
ncbi:hypothetical protein QBC35DRAFT_539458 [Podospora australis]|uniref:Protein kinase domain-containing protein n=1 Tax=Podospora australis TaxID=1536484 RepID=A0AAN6WM85_9PEZI|nr:hypothetical protein QBC35DRAFT_539458 [Podospora australis]